MNRKKFGHQWPSILQNLSLVYHYALIQDLSPLLLFEHNLGIMRSSNAFGRAFIGSVPILVPRANDKLNGYVYILHS